MAETALKRASLVALAIVEIVAFVVAVGTVGYFIDQISDERGSRQLKIDAGYYGRQEFFLFAASTGFFIAIFSMVIAIANLQEAIHWAGIMVALHVFCAIILLVSSSLLTKTTMTYDSSKLEWCKQMKDSSSEARCYQLIIGVVFGFVSIVLFIGDILIYIYTVAQIVGISFVNMDSAAARS